MKLFWRPLAIADRESIFEFISRDNPLAAIELDERIGIDAERLLQHPQIGRRGRAKGTRVRVVHPNYLLVYRVLDDCVEILRVKHAARQWPRT